MYIYDCLYGKMEFSKKEIACMISPEMQRLREVRLGNINSLFLTGSANINRFEHSVGTAYLAKMNILANKGTFPSHYKKSFVFAALFHDLANGPFGHSYEYIMERQGFNPEKSIGDVIFGRRTGSHRKVNTCEPFYLGEQNELSSILKRDEINDVDDIVQGNNKECSKILSSDIDIDNIDNVYRMAYHMGIVVNKRIPLELAKGIVCRDDEIFFKDVAIPYLYDWYETRSKVYKLLLYNPEDFSAKCMLSEVMDYVLQKKPSSVKWQYTDDELIQAFLKNNEEEWDDYYAIICDNLEYDFSDFSSEETIRQCMSELKIEIPSNASISIEKKDDAIFFTYYNTVFKITQGKLYRKEKRVQLNPSKLTTRLMRGDLYACIGIYVSKQTDKYDAFLNYESRKELERECNYYIERELGTKEFTVCFHAIVDKNKTNRQLYIQLETRECLTIGKPTHDLLIGAFIKNVKYGLANGIFDEKKRKALSPLIQKYLKEIHIDCQEHDLYSEVNNIE